MDESLCASPAVPSERSPSPGPSIPNSSPDVDQKPFRFLDLPKELRFLVYEFALGRRSIQFSYSELAEFSSLFPMKKITFTAYPLMMSAGKAIQQSQQLHPPRVLQEQLPNFRLLLTCRQIYYEANPFYTTKNVFVFENPSAFLAICIQYMPWTQAFSLRFLEIRMPVSPQSRVILKYEYEKYDRLFHDENPWHHRFWGQTMTGLKRVHIVAYLPWNSVRISNDRPAHCWAYERHEDPPNDKNYILAQKVREVPASLCYLAAYYPSVEFSVSVDDYALRRAYEAKECLKHWPREDRLYAYKESLQSRANLGDETLLRRLEQQQLCYQRRGKHGVVNCHRCARQAMLISVLNLRTTDKKIFINEYLRRLNECKTNGPESQNLVPWSDSDEIEALVDDEYEDDEDEEGKELDDDASGSAADSESVEL